MAFGSARLAFALLVSLNWLLWSQTRYGRVREASLLHGSDRHGSLVKRLYFDLAHSNETHRLDHLENQCRPLAFPIASQCAHVQKDCPAPDTFLSVPYLRSYFCTQPALRPLAFTALLTWLLFLFSTLGISASDFFTPNLATIAQLLGLDENVAGVTFLAFGNGSPDVFSTFSAMRAGSGSLAIGELLGAASFIVSCVVGSMCIIKPFHVHRGPFLRDVGFFTVAVAFLSVILWDSHIRRWEAGVLVSIYLVYVAVVIVSSWWERRQYHKKRIEDLTRSEYQEDFLEQEPYRDDPSDPFNRAHLVAPTPIRARAISSPGPPRLGLQTSLPRRPHSRTPSPTPSFHVSQMPSFSLVGALEFRQVVASLQHQAASSSLSIFESPVTPYVGGHYHRHSWSGHHTPVREVDPWDPALGLPLSDRSPPQLLVTAPLADDREDLHDDIDHGRRSQTSVPSISRTPASPTLSDGDTESRHFSPQTQWQRLMSTFRHIYHTLFPSLHHFRSKTVLGKIAAIFATPAILALTLTLPVIVTAYEFGHMSREKTLGAEGRLIDFEEEGIERALIAEEDTQDEMHDLTFNKWLMATQCAVGPLFCVGVLFSGTEHHIWLLIAAAIGGLATAALVAVFAEKGDHPMAQMARCSMGFLVAIVWIMAIADEVVNVLQTFGFIFGLSDAIIGLTIFAVGNSLADLVANMSVAVFAPIMGFSACFGGPMITILLGVGISGLYIIHQTGQPYQLHFSDTLMVSTIGLVALLLTTLVLVPLNGYYLTPRWGIFLIGSYTMIMGLNLFVELRG